jgi:flavodoxin
MKDRYIVDTNVIYAASAAYPSNPKDIDATPADPFLRMKIWQWLDEFDQGSSRLILDYQHQIQKEYGNKLRDDAFGIQVVLHKWDKQAVDLVSIEYDLDGHGVLTDTLKDVIHDNADKKMVAAALASYANFGQSCVAFAGDTDWHDWESSLADHNVELEPIIEEWSRTKHAEKAAR